MFESLLVANRGEIARRIIATANQMGIRTIAVYSEADADLPFVREADEAVLLGPAPPAQSYLDVDAVLAAAEQTGAQAIHPGYGFLSENADFAESVVKAGLIWVGPSPEAMRSMGDKIAARNRMAAAGVPVAPGTPDPVPDAQAALAAASEIGYPVMVKAAAGGGGIGMSAAFNDEELTAAYETARTRAERFFSDPAILLEKYVPSARHIEVQILGLADGTVVALGERDCSVQRRHQKVAEESPSPAVTPEIRAAICDAAVKAGEAVSYRNAGTVEMLFDTATGEAWFLEMNTRLQVEHPITEAITGIDIVREQIRIASGAALGYTQDDITFHGHAIECRINAEDPSTFMPSPGKIESFYAPGGAGIRLDSHIYQGYNIPPYYDSMIAKLIAHGKDRETSIARMKQALDEIILTGIKTNIPLHKDLILEDKNFCKHAMDIHYLEKHMLKQVQGHEKDA